MINIRNMVFETNSSSVNSIAVLTKEAFNKWNNDDTFIREPFYSGNLITVEDVLSLEEAVDDLDKTGSVEIGTDEYDFVKEVLCEWDYKTLEDVQNDEYLEYGKKEFTSPSGDELVIVSLSGYDG